MVFQVASTPTHDCSEIRPSGLVLHVKNADVEADFFTGLLRCKNANENMGVEDSQGLLQCLQLSLEYISE